MLDMSAWKLNLPLYVLRLATGWTQHYHLTVINFIKTLETCCVPSMFSQKTVQTRYRPKDISRIKGME